MELDPPTEQRLHRGSRCGDGGGGGGILRHGRREAGDRREVYGFGLGFGDRGMGEMERERERERGFLSAAFVEAGRFARFDPSLSLSLSISLSPSLDWPEEKEIFGTRVWI